MAYTEPARAGARHTRAAVYGQRRRRVRLGAVLVLLLACVAFTAVDHPLGGQVHPQGDRGRTYASGVMWPQQGQAALVLGDGRAAASPDEQAVPIASLAKVMTAYLTLERYPLSGAQDGFTITVNGADARAAAADAAQRQSVVAVRAGEQLTERQLL